MGRDYQKYKSLGPIVLNPTVEQIRSRIQDASDSLYYFPLHEIYLEDDIFKQTRSSPNFQGRYMTFTTCKQYLRTYKTVEDWFGLWYAGFTPIKGTGDNYIFFLGQIYLSFESNYNYGRWAKRTGKDLYKRKLADNDPRGDLYRPRRDLSGPERWDHTNFFEPPNHTRSLERYPDGSPKWWKDIDYTGMKDRHPAVFVFARSRSFLWSKPMYTFRYPMYRSGGKAEVGGFLNCLEKANEGARTTT